MGWNAPLTGSPLLDDGFDGQHAGLLEGSDVDLDAVVDVEIVRAGPAALLLALPAAADAVGQLVATLDQLDAADEFGDVVDLALERGGGLLIAALAGAGVLAA